MQNSFPSVENFHLCHKCPLKGQCPRDIRKIKNDSFYLEILESNRGRSGEKMFFITFCMNFLLLYIKQNLLPFVGSNNDSQYHREKYV